MNLHGIDAAREGNQRFLEREDYEKLFELYQTTIKKRKNQENSRISKLPKEADARLGCRARKGVQRAQRATSERAQRYDPHLNFNYIYLSL